MIYAYIGPYIKVSTTIKNMEIDHCKNQDACPNPQTKFCQTCGIGVKIRFSKSQQEIPNPSIPLLFAGERPFSDHSCLSYTYNKEEKERIRIFLPYTKKENHPRDFWSQFDEEHYFSINAEMIQKDLEWFKDAFASELKKMADHFGNIEIFWGYVDTDY